MNRPPPQVKAAGPQQVGLAFLSGSSLLLEIGLTRLFSTLYYPPYVFAVLSLAVLGLGLGAALAAWKPAWRRPGRAALYAALAGYAALLVLLLVVWTAPLSLPGLNLGLVPLPYFFVGLALATLFSAAPQTSPGLYRADLLGAGAGAVLAIPLLDGLGGLNGVLAAAGVFGLAAVLLARSLLLVDSRSTAAALALCGLTVLGLATNLPGSIEWLAVDMARLPVDKPIRQSLAGGGTLLDTRWDSFARTDLVDPGQGRPYELYLDGAAGSVMPPAGDVNLLRTDIGFFPFATAQPRQVMLIGPGGGLDVWFALNGQAQQITAVEINPAAVAMVNRYVDYHGNLYGRPGVDVRVDEGRSVLRRQAQRYDLIYLSQVVTLAAERSGYALTENSIYTVEAFHDYLAHLQPGGQIAMKLYDELTLTRAMVTAVTALVDGRGVSQAEAMGHLAVFLDPDAEPPIPLLLVQNQPFTPDEALSYAGVAAQVGFEPLFVPGMAAGPTLERLLSGESSLADIIANSPSDVSPTTDDRPFFYQFEPGLPRSLLPLLGGLAGLAVVGAVGLLIGQRPYREPLVRYAPAYFAALGVGFIAVEIALIQQTRLFLGHPTLAITTVLATLLVGGGLGSGLAGGWPAAAQQRRLSWILAAIVLLVLLWLAGWPWLSQLLRAQSQAMRLGSVILLLLPLALLLGMPFPLGLKAVSHAPPGDRHVALAWAVNGVLTVVGSAGAVAMAMLFGFSAVLLVGAGAYTAAALYSVWCR